MGVSCQIYQVVQSEVERIDANPESILAIIQAKWKRQDKGSMLSMQLTLFDLPALPSPKIWCISLQKDWYVLHFLLNQGDSIDVRLADAILGGELIQGDEFKIHGRAKVQEVAEALESLTHEELRRRFDSPKFREEVATACFYERVEDYWTEDRQEDFPFLTVRFDSLLEIYRDASRCDNSLLIELQ
jgi:Domain of unknown function (DUF1877)